MVSAPPVPATLHPVRVRKKSGVSESPEEGWVKVWSNRSRRGSQSSQSEILSPDPESDGPDPIEKLVREEVPDSSPPVQQLPMFPGPASSLSPAESSLTGTRPKLTTGLSSLPAFTTLISNEDDCIYHSDEDIPFGDENKIAGLSPIGSPVWSGKPPFITLNHLSTFSPDMESSTSNQDKEKEMEALYENTKSFEKNVIGQNRDGLYGSQILRDNELWSGRAKLTKDLMEMTDISGGWDTFSTGSIWRPKQEFEKCKEELKMIKEDLEEERKQKETIVEEHEKLQELFKEEKETKTKLETLKKESVATVLKEQKDIQVRSSFVSVDMSTLTWSLNRSHSPR